MATITAMPLIVIITTARNLSVVRIAVSFATFIAMIEIY